MITRRQFSKLGIGLAAFSQTACHVFGQDGGDDLATSPILKEGVSIRRVGVRVNGEYWGMMGEKIDMLSGNLNYSIPLLRAGGRGVTVDVVCSYNSQLWKKNEQSTQLYGADLGCGFGWYVRIGSIVPRFEGNSIVGYIFVDRSGAEYPLVPSSTISNNWICLQGLCISYDAENACIKFPNGDFWIMGCESAADERDAGVLYPTLIQDTNGNRITIEYMQGAGSTELNSSSRILAIRDARAVDTDAGRRTYSFLYSEDHIPHLMAITNPSVDEHYTFSYKTQQLNSPFDYANLGSVSALAGVQISSRKHSFAYNEYGELAEVQIPFGGCLRWGYNTIDFSNGRKIREVISRTVALSAQAAGSTYTIGRKENNNAHIHGSAILCEPNHSAERLWSFCTDASSPYFGLATSFEERGQNGNSALRRSDYTWSRTSSGVPFKSCISTALDPGTQDSVSSKTEFERDIFGNLTEERQYDYNESNTPFRTIRHAYLTDAAYLSRNIFNRRISTTESNGTEMIRSMKYKYDTTPLVDRAGVLEHDNESCTVSNTTRGNVTEVERNNRSMPRKGYSITGVPTYLELSPGKYINYAPSNDTLFNILTIWGIPAGDLDYHGKTAKSYESGRWKLENFDGLGRVTSIQRGKGEEIISIVEREYNWNKKPKRSSWPHAPNSKPEWIQRDYDGLGRKTQIGNTKYVYKGNSTLVIDTTGGWKKFFRDASGKLKKVVTPNPQSGPDLETTYRYDSKGRLAGVTMPRLDGTQKRDFLFNPDAKESSVTQAEDGRKIRRFNNDGTFASSTDAKGQWKKFLYDEKKRIVSVQRTDAKGQIQPSQCVTYSYDFNPYDATFSQNTYRRLAAMRWGSSDVLPGLMMEMYSYTDKGKLAAKRLRINRGKNDVDFDLQYRYDYEGRLSGVIYPKGGPSLQYMYDDAGRPTLLLSGSDILVKDVAYDPITGRMASYKQYVPEAGSFLEHKQEFDSKLRVNRIVAEFENDHDPIVDIGYEYDAVHRLAKEEDRVSNEVVNYKYDASGRLARAESEGINSWETNYLYDGFGNRISQQNNSGAVPELAVAHDPATNQVVSNSVGYDANGNIAKLFDMNLSFDIENRLVEINKQNNGTEQYAYDPKNLRIWKKLVTGDEELHFYGTGGQRMAVYKLTTDEQGNLAASPQDYDMYFAGKLLRSNSKPVVLDRLGSVRAWVDTNKSINQVKYYPFGEERKITYSNRKKFGTYLRDDFSGLDYAEQRYYSSALGRFITPDPYPGSIILGNPETWNRYAYVVNNPINFSDPHGLSLSTPLGQNAPNVTVSISLPNAIGNLQFLQNPGCQEAFYQSQNGPVWNLLLYTGLEITILGIDVTGGLVHEAITACTVTLDGQNIIRDPIVQSGWADLPAPDIVSDGFDISTQQKHDAVYDAMNAGGYHREETQILYFLIPNTSNGFYYIETAPFQRIYDSQGIFYAPTDGLPRISNASFSPYSVGISNIWDITAMEAWMIQHTWFN
jgi:RHS repeat-associated protein